MGAFNLTHDRLSRFFSRGRKGSTDPWLSAKILVNIGIRKWAVPRLRMETSAMRQYTVQAWAGLYASDDAEAAWRDATGKR